MSNNNEEYLEEVLIQSSSENRFVRYVLNVLSIGTWVDGWQCGFVDIWGYLVNEQIQGA